MQAKGGQEIGCRWQPALLEGGRAEQIGEVVGECKIGGSGTASII